MDLTESMVLNFIQNHRPSFSKGVEVESEENLTE